jgi:hypothetical protein
VPEIYVLSVAMVGVLSGKWAKYIFIIDSLFSFGALLETIEPGVIKERDVDRN